MKIEDEIQIGLKIDDPQILLEWNSSQLKILEQLCMYPYKRVTSSYLCFEASVFDSSIRCMIGLHFSCEDSKSFLAKIEFFRVDNQKPEEKSIIQSFIEFQAVLENKYGRAYVSRPNLYFKKNSNSNSINDSCWIIGKIHIYHFILDRFGYEEHLSISAGTSSDEFFFHS